VSVNAAPSPCACPGASWHVYSEFGTPLRDFGYAEEQHAAEQHHASVPGVAQGTGVRARKRSADDFV
jgi:hypothetical protein